MWRQGWREVGSRKIFFRSSWECNYARYLEYLKLQGQISKWDHEPKTFWFEGIKRGCVSYLPDFRIERLNGSHYWVEVKGWMTAKSKTKIKRFKKYYPSEELHIVDKKWFLENSSKLKLIIEQWE